ncbi:photosystem II stability/assembly factor-like uncharacterized protein [Granulicella aggregans]|uniref:Photosystem II stability/assembly factor-like uncharacterized protein n=1 Tax=Granulicella aggregans TaxID=474949 RepID=A0A7W7ZIB4_9BACT|nr:hypothetical protein [Granulicella aggregans]MBB5060465.1 photosystem II stability/assembly factor-like uncharacterized protein [Granulicella aggregans]
MTTDRPFFARCWLALHFFFWMTATAFAADMPGVPYTWKNVQIVGGGFVDGVVFHPSATDIRYARTDMGGAYKWDPAIHRWSPILDFIPYKDLNLMGVESIALDPNDAKVVYLAAGTYTNAATPNGAILRSDDEAKHFKRIDVPIKFGGNEDGRGNGERLAVDPSDGRVLYLGTRHDGLWRSTNRGDSWSRIASFPDITETIASAPPPVAGETPRDRYRRMPIHGDGIVFVKFGHAERERQPTATIYIGVSLKGRSNLFVSHDSGATWAAIPDEPVSNRPLRAALATDGSLYVTYGSTPGPTPMKDGGVWKLNTATGKWNDITPDRPVPGGREFGYAGVSVDAQRPQTVIVSTYNRYMAGGEEIFRSTDGGATWRKIFTQGGTSAGVFDYSNAPYVQKTGIHWLFDIEIDPRNSSHAVFTTGYGGWETYDLEAIDHGRPTHWKLFTPGIEEVVGLQLDSPTAGPPLLSAIGDYGGFTHHSLDSPAPEGSSQNPRFGNTTSIVSATLQPQIVVRTGENADHHAQNIGISLDGGTTWQPAASPPRPDSHSGSVAVSSEGDVWIWTPEHDVPYVTRDRGVTWAAISTLPPDTRVVADPMEPRKFYAISLRDLRLFTSVDAGASFETRSFTYSDGPSPVGAARGDVRGGQDRLYATPGASGDLWLPAFNGLYHLHGDVFERLPDVEAIHAFGFGKAALGVGYPTLYLVGKVGTEAGIFRSTDIGRHWLRINDDQHQWGLILQIAGDPKQFGRIYVGTHGRGIFYGDPD